MKTQAEKTLDLIQAVLAGEVIERQKSDGAWGSSMFVGNSLISAIIDTSDKYRIKPNPKTITYQTRLCKIGTRVYQWSSLNVNAVSQKHLEDEYVTLNWLQTTQEHSLTYEEK